MTEKIITCITCPIGCRITVRGVGGEVTGMEGYQCKRGQTYARSEYTHPERILTSTVRVEGGTDPLVAVRSSKPVPKDLLLDCMAEIRAVCAHPPVKRYDVLIPNILDTGADIVATGEVRE